MDWFPCDHQEAKKSCKVPRAVMVKQTRRTELLPMMQFLRTVLYTGLSQKIHYAECIPIAPEWELQMGFLREKQAH
jgi:hypothetical protein